MCCLQEVRWRGQIASMQGMKVRKDKLWWSGKDGFEGVGVIGKEELCEKVIEVRRLSHRVMTVSVVVLEERVQG